MLDYEWGNPSGMMLIPNNNEDESDHNHNNNNNNNSDPTRQTFFMDHHHHQQNTFSHHFLSSNTTTNDLSNSNPNSFPHHFYNPNPNPNPNYSNNTQNSFYGASPYAAMMSGESYMVVPKSEEQQQVSRIGLNLGGRTYFASSEDDFVSRLYRRPRPIMDHSNMIGGNAVPAPNSPRCQAEGCNADLSHAKHYHRRHKVCEFHSKASTVIAAGLTQRFCQQCSRFHLLSEFDNGKRSCRKRLADHNRRRRKTQQQPCQDINNNNINPKPSSTSCSSPQLDNINPRVCDNNLSSDHRSPPDSGAQSSSSVTVAVSPPRMSLDCFRQRSTYHQTTASSGSSGSLFFSSG